MRRCILLSVFALISAGSVRGDDQIVALESAGIDLSAITDRTDLAFEESPAYYAILEYVRHVPTSDLVSAAQKLKHERWRTSERFHARRESEFPTFVDLIEHPDVYRGRPVTLSGHLIRLVTYPSGPNDEGIDTLYEGWLVTEHSQQHPASIICTEIPEGMPIGEEVSDGVSVSGYFFKLHTYPSRDKKIRFAPMILAHTMTWRPPPPAVVGWTGSPLVLYGGLAVGVLVISAAIWMSARRRRRRRDGRRESLPDDPPEFLKSLTP